MNVMFSDLWHTCDIYWFNISFVVPLHKSSLVNSRQDIRLAEEGLQQFGLQAVDDIKSKPRIFGYQLCWHAVGLHAAG